MMSPDDEPLSQLPKQNKNSLINEAFNLSASFSASNTLTVLPPTSNHFQPIHSRTPSAEIKPPPLPPSLLSNPSSFFDQQIINTTTTTTSNNNNTNIMQAFQQPLLNNTEIMKPVEAASLFAPVIPTKQPQVVSNFQINTNLPPPSVVPPPLSKPIIPNSTTTTTSNPYAAKGALNKKVFYDNIIPVAPMPTSNQTITPALFLNPNNEQQQVPTTTTTTLSNDVFTPLPKSASNTSLTHHQYQPPASVPLQQQMYNPPTTTTPLLNLTNENIQSTINYDNNSTTYQNDQSTIINNNNNNRPANNTGTMWNWFTQNKLVNTFVEKAKYGVETIVTTVDPQMKDYIHPANRPFNIVSSISNAKLLHTLRESFSNAGFSKITINATDIQNSTLFAPQIVGFPCALQSAKEKLENTLFALQQQQQQQQQTSDCVVISFQDFLAELSTDCWYELAVIMLKDKTNNIDLTIYTEAVPVLNEDLNQLQQYTPNDFQQSWSGYAVRLPEKNFNFNGSNSTHSSNMKYLNYDTNETVLSQARLSHALHSLAILFKNKLLTQIK